MSWRTVVITKPSKLDFSMGYLVVRDVTATIKVHISEISVLMIENTATSLTAALLSALMQQKVKVIFCDSKRNPEAELIPYYGSHDCSLKWKKQIQWDPFYKEAVWTEIVTEKNKKSTEFACPLRFSAGSYIGQLSFGYLLEGCNQSGRSCGKSIF